MIIRGDCVEVMAGMDAGSVDAIVTDPPYGLGFMGKQWDDLPPGPEFAAVALRVLKPGGHLLAFGGTRTYHRLTVAVEDAGFEIRDCLSWLYGSGFPKSHNVSKAIDKAAGAEREVVGIKHADRYPNGPGGNTFTVGADPDGTRDAPQPLTAPATDDAAKWEGFGTALKPSWEPIIMARKPLTGTVAANVLEHGVGALNIDGCRVGTGGNLQRPERRGKGSTGGWADYEQEPGTYGTPEGLGRWPANTVLDEQAAAILDEQVGELKAGVAVRRNGVRGGDIGPPGNKAVGTPDLGYGDTGGPSRFFYVAKASRKERNAGLDDRNPHPTVKPINLMRWLVRMVTPPGGTVLDPFTGSGTTGCAAVLEGFDFIGIEREPDYADIAEARIKHWSALDNRVLADFDQNGLTEKKNDQP